MNFEGAQRPYYQCAAFAPLPRREGVFAPRARRLRERQGRSSPWKSPSGQPSSTTTTRVRSGAFVCAGRVLIQEAESPPRPRPARVSPECRRCRCQRGGRKTSPPSGRGGRNHIGQGRAGQGRASRGTGWARAWPGRQSRAWALEAARPRPPPSPPGPGCTRGRAAGVGSRPRRPAARAAPSVGLPAPPPEGFPEEAGRRRSPWRGWKAESSAGARLCLCLCRWPCPGQLTAAPPGPPPARNFAPSRLGWGSRARLLALGWGLRGWRAPGPEKPRLRRPGSRAQRPNRAGAAVPRPPGFALAGEGPASPCAPLGALARPRCLEGVSPGGACPRLSRSGGEGGAAEPRAEGRLPTPGACGKFRAGRSWSPACRVGSRNRLSSRRAGPGSGGLWEGRTSSGRKKQRGRGPEPPRLRAACPRTPIAAGGGGRSEHEEGGCRFPFARTVVSRGLGRSKKRCRLNGSIQWGGVLACHGGTTFEPFSGYTQMPGEISSRSES
ncbi:basic proline-rich protein-like [Eublepharis macularius]|uniref:Basic proline-rich protein-like n=1 Tax=Eublepharis macularius TaxID=481883 RepID=A0AA97L6P5_EUBMA|nr:basic proline-rich protein-like [Eublepharis macularius]